MPTPTPLGAAGELAASRHGAFTRRQAASLGLDATQIRTLIAARTLAEPVPGVLVHTSFASTWRQQLAVAGLWSNGVATASFRAAAGFWELDGYRPEGMDLLMHSPRKPRVPGAVHHVGPTDPSDIVEVDGIRVTTIERTLCDLGSVDPEDRVREAFECAWRRGLSLDHLQTVIDRLHRPGQHGTSVAQRLLVDAIVKGRSTESALEVRLEAILHDVDGLVRQYEIRTPSGGFVARVDFAVPGERLAIEAHSRQFHSGAAAEARDARRHQRIAALGWTVLYITHEQMQDPIKVRALVQREISRRPRGETQLRGT
jgi:very-short-patch-repair endonuclease